MEDASFYRKLAFGSAILVCGLILLYHDSQQMPQGPAFSYSRQGLELISAADGDQKKLEEAVSRFYEALRMDPKDPLALFGMGWALQERGFSHESESYYERALGEMRELGGYSAYNLGIARQERGDAEGARRMYEQALGFDPAFAPALERLAKLGAPDGQ